MPPFPRCHLALLSTVVHSLAPDAEILAFLPAYSTDVLEELAVDEPSARNFAGWYEGYSPVGHFSSELVRAEEFTLERIELLVVENHGHDNALG